MSEPSRNQSLRLNDHIITSLLSEIKVEKEIITSTKTDRNDVKLSHPSDDSPSTDVPLKQGVDAVAYEETNVVEHAENPQEEDDSVTFVSEPPNSDVIPDLDLNGLSNGVSHGKESGGSTQTPISSSDLSNETHQHVGKDVTPPELVHYPSYTNDVNSTMDSQVLLSSTVDKLRVVNLYDSDSGINSDLNNNEMNSGSLVGNGDDRSLLSPSLGDQVFPDFLRLSFTDIFGKPETPPSKDEALFSYTESLGDLEASSNINSKFKYFPQVSEDEFPKRRCFSQDVEKTDISEQSFPEDLQYKHLLKTPEVKKRSFSEDMYKHEIHERTSGLKSQDSQDQDDGLSYRISFPIERGLRLVTAGSAVEEYTQPEKPQDQDQETASVIQEVQKLEEPENQSDNIEKLETLEILENPIICTLSEPDRVKNEDFELQSLEKIQNVLKSDKNSVAADEPKQLDSISNHNVDASSNFTVDIVQIAANGENDVEGDESITETISLCGFLKSAPLLDDFTEKWIKSLDVALEIDDDFSDELRLCSEDRNSQDAFSANTSGSESRGRSERPETANSFFSLSNERVHEFWQRFSSKILPSAMAKAEAGISQDEPVPELDNGQEAIESGEFVENRPNGDKTATDNETQRDDDETLSPLTTGVVVGTHPIISMPGTITAKLYEENGISTPGEAKSPEPSRFIEQIEKTPRVKSAAEVKTGNNGLTSTTENSGDWKMNNHLLLIKKRRKLLKSFRGEVKDVKTSEDEITKTNNIGKVSWSKSLMRSSTFTKKRIKSDFSLNSGVSLEGYAAEYAEKELKLPTSSEILSTDALDAQRILEANKLLDDPPKEPEQPISKGSFLSWTDDSFRSFLSEKFAAKSVHDYVPTPLPKRPEEPITKPKATFLKDLWSVLKKKSNREASEIAQSQMGKRKTIRFAPKPDYYHYAEASDGSDSHENKPKRAFSMSFSRRSRAVNVKRNNSTR